MVNSSIDDSALSIGDYIETLAPFKGASGSLLCLSRVNDLALSRDTIMIKTYGTLYVYWVRNNDFDY